jgi:hypothetical protein
MRNFPPGSPKSTEPRISSFKVEDQFCPTSLNLVLLFHRRGRATLTFATLRIVIFLRPPSFPLYIENH